MQFSSSGFVRFLHHHLGDCKEHLVDCKEVNVWFTTLNNVPVAVKKSSSNLEKFVWVQSPLYFAKRDYVDLLNFHIHDIILAVVKSILEILKRLKSLIYKDYVPFAVKKSSSNLELGTESIITIYQYCYFQIARKRLFQYTSPSKYQSDKPQQRVNKILKFPEEYCMIRHWVTTSDCLNFSYRCKELVYIAVVTHTDMSLTT